MKDDSKSFSSYTEMLSPESPSSSLVIILDLICFEPEAKLFWFAELSGKTWSQCFCALFYKAPLALLRFVQ